MENPDEIIKVLPQNEDSVVDMILEAARFIRAARNLVVENGKLQSQLATSQCMSAAPCCDCGGEVVEFTVPNDIWNFVMRPDGHETDKEYLCWNCWNKALRRKIQSLQHEKQAAVEKATKLDRAIFDAAMVASGIEQSLNAPQAGRGG